MKGSVQCTIVKVWTKSHFKEDPKFRVLSGLKRKICFYAPVTIVRGALRFAPVCPYVHQSVYQALPYRVCVINSSHSF